jgi:hypothetical protein
MMNSPNSQFLLNHDGPWWGAGSPPTATGFPGQPNGEQLMKAYFPGGWSLGGGKYDIASVPSCDSWGKTHLPWSDAMGAVFISGFFYLFFTFTGLRGALFRAVPKSLRSAITVGCVAAPSSHLLISHPLFPASDFSSLCVHLCYPDLSVCRC